MRITQQREFWRCVGEKGKEQKTSFGWVSEGIAQQLTIQQIEISPTALWTTRPEWMLEESSEDLEIWNIKRRNKTADLVQEFYNYVDEKYGKYVYIYTDGSEEPITGATGAAVVIPSHHTTISKRPSDHLSTYVVELCAVLPAIEWMEDKVDKKIVICSDSVSSILSIKNRTVKTHQEILYEILVKTSRLIQQGKEITFMWVPAHSGIQGN